MDQVAKLVAAKVVGERDEVVESCTKLNEAKEVPLFFKKSLG